MFSSPRALVSLVLLAACGQALATGPTQQRLPWRAIGQGETQFSTLNSVVKINRFNNEGTGTIVSKYIDNGQAWISILSADHVLTGNPLLLGIQFGDEGAAPAGIPQQNLTVILEGQNSNAKYLQRSGEDLGVLGLRLGNVVGNDAETVARRAFFDQLRPATLDAVTTQDLLTSRRIFSSVGYGGTGTFVQGGMQAVTDNNAAPFVLTNDGKKRFQNNRFERTVNASDMNYSYTGIQADFNAPTDTGFLVAEGVSFPGDSGSPLFQATNVTQTVEAITRPGGFNWAAGEMSLYSNALVAVMTQANARPSSVDATTRFNPYDTTRMTAIPLTAARVTWIEEWSRYVPTPGAASTLAMFALLTTRRRR